MRFLSVEPMLGDVEFLDEWIVTTCPDCNGSMSVPVDGGGRACDTCWRGGGPTGFLEGLQWVICGGESGPGHRPLDLDAARRLQARCWRAGVPFFFKQTSGHRPGLPGPEDLERTKEFPPEARRAR